MQRGDATGQNFFKFLILQAPFHEFLYTARNAGHAVTPFLESSSWTVHDVCSHGTACMAEDIEQGIAIRALKDKNRAIIVRGKQSLNDIVYE